MKQHAELVAALILALGMCAVAGCDTTEEVTVEQAQAESAQKYDYKYVKDQAERLEPGMSKAEVLIALGSPAVREPARWVYRPKRSGVVVPAEAMVVRFDRGRYVSHTFQPIVLGEQLGDP